MPGVHPANGSGAVVIGRAGVGVARAAVGAGAGATTSLRGIDVTGRGAGRGFRGVVGLDGTVMTAGVVVAEAVPACPGSTEESQAVAPRPNANAAQTAARRPVFMVVGFLTWRIHPSIERATRDACRVGGYPPGFRAGAYGRVSDATRWTHA